MARVLADFHAVTSDHRLKIPLRQPEGDLIKVGQWLIVEDIFGGGQIEGVVSAVDSERHIALVVIHPQPVRNRFAEISGISAAKFGSSLRIEGNELKPQHTVAFP
jgi:hypothetical protein